MPINYKEKYDEYHNKFWKLHHANKILTSEINDLKIKIGIYEGRILSGKIKKISPVCDWGLLTNLEHGDIFFHQTKCNFPLSNTLIDKSVNYNLTINTKFEAYNVSLEIDSSVSHNPFDILDMISYLPKSVDDKSVDDKLMVLGLITPQEDPYLDMINAAQDIWYMNFRVWDIDCWNGWLNCKDNGFVTTWNNHGRNDSLYEKLKVNDIIAWYLVGKGYLAILKVTGKVCKLQGDDLKIFKCGDEQQIKGHLEWEKKETYCCGLKIPVKFLSHMQANNCIQGLDGHNESWTSGFRGSCAIKPKNKKWKDQVIGMYLEMIS